LKRQRQITAVIINGVVLFKNEIISVKLSKTIVMYLCLSYWGVLNGIYWYFTLFM